ncbi:MAG TPA: hypothetical protein VLT33_49720, partial [Labilithrix sp.]|nr:hypothetical protein [Labilithrix sp.]
MNLLGRNIVFSSAALALAVVVFSACSKSDGDGSESGDNAITGTACQILNVKAGRPMTTEELAKLDDPIAAFALAGADCPKGFAEITAKLKKTDTVGCNGSGPPSGGGSSSGGVDSGSPGSGGEGGAPAPSGSAAPSGPDTAGISARFVSETSQVEGKGDSYRAVVARQCNGRQDHELLISLFGIGADGSLPNDLEAIGKDKTSGVFNYYAREDNTWKFFGSSLDLIGDGYDCNANGACTPKAASKTRCAGCHVGGGLIMKELESPWVHWEGDTQTPGLEKLFTASPGLLGSRGNGIDMESKVNGGNTAYTPKRVAFLKTKGVAEVLRPLFCTLDINLQSAGGTSVPTSIRNEVFLDPAWQSFDSPPINAADYTALVAQFRQRIAGNGGSQLKDKAGKPVDDTFFKFTFPERSKADGLYVQQLVAAKIVDDDFVKDVLDIDFTRPIFSPTRCGLLKFAPTLTADKMTPDAIRDGFKKALATETSAAGKKLAANLAAAGDAAAHKTEVDKYLTACKARDKKALLTDVFAFVAHQRRAARANVANSRQGIIEF